MARTTLTKTTLAAAYPALPVTADSLDVNFQAATGSSGSSGNQFAFGSSSRLIVLAWNTHATNAYTWTATSVVDQYNRTGDISGYSLAAGEVSVKIFERGGWAQSDGYLYLEANNAAVKFAAWEG